MKKVIERIVESPGAPNENDLWLNGKTLKGFQNGQWVTISGGDSDSSDSDSDSGDGSFEQVQADWEQDDTTAVDYIKNKPTIPSAPMIVSGTVGGNNAFTPGPGEPTFAEAMDHMFRGGLVYMLLLVEGEPTATALADYADFECILSSSDGDTLEWSNPGEGGEGGNEPLR